MVQRKSFSTMFGWVPALAVLLAAPAAAQQSSPGASAGTPTEVETPHPTSAASETPHPAPTASETPRPAPTASETPRPAPTATETFQAPDEVVVRGGRLSEIKSDLRININNFLKEVAAPARGRGYARWHRQVCIGVDNLEKTAAQYVVDRISSLALDVGLKPGGPGCRPQVNIVFATDARQLSTDMVKTEPRIFRPFAGFAGADLGLEALDEFANSDKPVRWWHVSMPVDARTGALAIEVPESRLCGQQFCPPTVNVAGPSFIHNGTVDELRYVIIVVDVTKLPGTTWQQIADYLAVVSLAQIDPRADPSAFDSILNLFSNPAAYSGLTDWDRSYIHALYSIDQERISSAQQDEIVSRMAKRELDAAE
jgi:hypothetical protein